METKLFTLEQANAMIPQVNREILKLQALKHDFNQKAKELKKIKQTQIHAKQEQEADPFFTLEVELEFIQIEAKSHIQTISRLGIELKDIDLGLVDFPSKIDGKIVMLCWKQGEDQIRYYHTLEGGFAGRKPIEEDHHL